MIKYLFISLLLVVSAPSVGSEEQDQAIHEELRGLLKGIEQAVNSEKYSELRPFFHEKMRVTTINQEVILSHDEIVAYFDKWFGPDGFLKKVHMTLNADELTELYNNNTVGIVRGSGDENYILADDRTFEMKTRWTATVIKGADGKWRILSLHIGTDFLDNPILDIAEQSLIRVAIIGVAAGILLGLIIGFVFRRLKKK